MTKELAFYKRLTANTAYLMTGSVFANLTMFVSGVLMARFFSPAEYGVITLIISINAFFILIPDIGIPIAVTKFIPENITEPKQLSAIISSSLKLVGILSIIAITILFLSSGWLTRTFFDQDVKRLLQISAIWIGCYLLFKVTCGAYNGFQCMGFSLINILLFEGLRFTALIAVICLGGGIYSIIIGWTVAKITAVLCVLIIFLYFLTKKNIKLQWNTGCELRIIKYGIYLAIPFLGIYLIPYLLNILIGWLLTTESVAFMAISLSLSSLSFLFLLPISKAMFPAISQAFANDNMQQISSLAEFSFKYVWLLSFSILFLLTFFADRIITLIYGTKYLAASTPLIVMAFAVFFESSKAITNPMLNGTKYAKTVAIIETLKFILILILGITLIYFKGITGAAIALLIAYLVSTILKMYQVKKALDINLIETAMEFIPLVIAIIIFLMLKLPAWLFAILAIAYIVYRKLISVQEICLIRKLFTNTDSQ